MADVNAAGEGNYDKTRRQELNALIEKWYGKAQAVTDTKLEDLTREVREHNNFAKRMPVVEEQIKVINHRIDDLEGFHKCGDGWQK